MGKMYLMCGLSGAGKTTFAKKFAEDNGYTYLGIDDFYATYAAANHMTSPWSNSHASFDVWIKYFYAIHTLEMEGKDVIIDTNAPTFVKRIQFIDWFPTFQEHNLIYIDIKDEELRKKNNASRGRIVPADEMERMRKEFEEPVEFFSDNDLVFAYGEKRWNNIIVYKNIDNNFILCKNSYLV